MSDLEATARRLFPHWSDDKRAEWVRAKQYVQARDGAKTRVGCGHHIPAHLRPVPRTRQEAGL